MTVTSIEKDYENLTLTLIAEFEAPLERVWEMWADPRKLERWWGPPTHPATFEEHNLTPGGRVSYFLTSPEGEKHRGWWQIVSVDPPTSLSLNDGFADQDGNPVSDMPSMSMHVQLSRRDNGTRMEAGATYASREDMDKVLAMGVEEGMRASVGQIDALLVA